MKDIHTQFDNWITMIRMVFGMIIVMTLICYCFAVSFDAIPEDNQGMVNFIAGILVGSLLPTIARSVLGIATVDTPKKDSKNPDGSTTTTVQTVIPNTIADISNNSNP